MASEFSKYRDRGAYHWADLSSNPFRAWPYTRSRIRWVARRCGDARTVLEIGCGDGAILGLLAGAGKEVTGIDSEPRAIELAREIFAKRNLRGEFLSSIEDLRDRRFDAVILAEVIEHLTKPEEVLVAVKEHLHPEGCFVMTTPIRLLERSLDPHHVHEFWPGELGSLLGEHFEEVVSTRMHPAWLIDLTCFSVKSLRPYALAANLVWLLTRIELLEWLRSPLGLYWTQGAVCRRAKVAQGTPVARDVNDRIRLRDII